MGLLGVTVVCRLQRSVAGHSQLTWGVFVDLLSRFAVAASLLSRLPQAPLTVLALGWTQGYALLDWGRAALVRRLGFGFAA